MEKKPKKSGKKWLLIGGIVVVLAAAGAVFVYMRTQSQPSSTASSYKTQAAAKGSLSTSVGANGNVYTRQTVSLSWGTSGTVSQVSVTKGQQVDKGTVLAQLDQSSLPQSVLSAATDLAAAQKSLDDLLNSNTARANAQLALLTAEQTLVSAQKTAQSKLYQRASQTVVDTAKANLIQAQTALDRASTAYNNVKSSSDTMVYASALSQFAAAQQTFDKAQMNYQYAQSMPDTLSVQIANADVDVAQAAYNDAKRAWERVKDGPNADDVAAAEAKVAQAQATLDQARITAPISGTITAINTTPGDLVSSGTAAVQIDDMSHLYVDISVSEVDISQVKVGQPAEITFDAIANKTYNGKVTDIATTGTSSSGAVNFYVTVGITNKDAQIKPGMTATANITVTQKTDVLLVPASAIRTVNNQSMVYVDQSGTLRPVFITTGDTDSTNTEVTGGNLNAGDLVVTNPPSSATALSSAGLRQTGLFGGLFSGIFGGGGGGGFVGGGGMPPSGGGPGGDFGGPPGNNSNSTGSRSSGGSGSSNNSNPQPNGGGG
ncbi:MAG TPA: efflux RND transporter periplasmic adaptor subunit [Anaerolineaceae bacterium]